MKKFFLMFALFFSVTLCLQSAFAQYESYTQMGLPEGAIARFSKGYIVDIMYSPDGTRLAVTTTIGVWLYNAQTGEELDLITGGHTGSVYSAAYSPDSKTIATGSGDRTIRLWDTRTGKNIKTFKGYTYGIGLVVYSPNGKTIAILNGRKSTIELLNARTGKHLKTLTGHEKPKALYEGHTDVSITSFAYSPDSKTIVSGGGDKTVRLWNARTGGNIRTLTGHTEAVRAVAYSPDGGTIVSASRDKTVRMWDANTGENIKTFTGHNDIIVSVAYSPDGSTIISAGWDGMLHRWDAQTGKPLKTYEIYTGVLYFARGHGGAITHTAYSPDGETIATAGADGKMQWWDAHTGENIKTFTEYVSGSRTITYSPDKKKIAVTAGGKVNLWNASGKHLKTLTGHKGYVAGITFSPEGNVLVTGSSDRTARLWNVHTGENIKILTGHTGIVYNAIFSADGDNFITRGGNNLRMWSANTREHLKTFEGDVYGCRWFKYSPDGKIIATRFNDTVRLLDTHTRETKNVLIGHTGRIVTAVFSPNGDTVATFAKDNTFRLWNPHTGENIKTLHITGTPITVIYPSDSDPITISVNKEAVTLSNVVTGQHLKTLESSGRPFFGMGQSKKSFGPPPYHIRTVRYSPNGETLATVRYNETAQLWNVNTGKRIGKLIKPLKDDPSEGDTWVEYSPDGNILATTQIGNLGGTVRLWNTATGKHIKTLKGHTYCGNSFEFSSDSKTIITGHYDGTLILWDIPAR
ncbi:MAG: WD40 repeat domain-containing protein [Candidatus Poribacteria bacterium]|nr:WD40 repeat domain-containing protein [Candidatus Poribacteria bacterium]